MGGLQPRSVPECGLRASAARRHHPPRPPPTYIFPEGVQDEGLELRQTLVDARSAPLLHDRLGGLRVGLRLSPASARPRPTRATHAPSGPTFRCSAALRGLFGALLALAGAPASGEALGFPGVSAGMVRPRACRRRASLSGAARLPGRRAARRAAAKGEARGLCEPGPAVFPTLAPANERPRPSPRPAPAPPPPRQPSVTRRLAAHQPAGHKGGPRHPPAHLRNRAGKSPRERRARLPRPRNPGAGRNRGVHLQAEPARGGLARRIVRGRRGKSERKIREGHRVRRPRGGRASAHTPPASSAVRGPCPRPGPLPSCRTGPAACPASRDPRRLQHLRKSRDTVDVDRQTLGGRGVGWPGHEAGWRHTTMK